jgi:WD40 repeat protein
MKRFVICLIVFLWMTLVSAQDDLAVITPENVAQIELLSFTPLEGNPYAADIYGDMLVVGTAYNRIFYCELPCTSYNEVESGSVETLRFSPNGAWVAAGIFTFNENSAVEIWQVVDGGLEFKWVLNDVSEATRAGVRDLAFSPDGSLLAVGSEDSTLRVWEVQTGELVAVIEQASLDSIDSVAFSPDGTILASSNAVVSVEFESQETNAGVNLWDTTTQPYTLIDTLQGHVWWASDVVFSADGQYLISAEGTPRDMELKDIETIRVWDMTTHENVYSLAGHTYNIWKLVINPAGDLLVSTSSDGTIRFWELESFEALHVLNGSTDYALIYDAAFNADGTILVSVEYDGVRLWGVRE